MKNEGFKRLADQILNYTMKKGADDSIVNAYSADIRQIRFSENSIDIFNSWNEVYFHLFMASKRRVVSTVIKGGDNYRVIVDNAVKTAEASQPSDDYMGIAERSTAVSRTGRWKPVADSRLANHAMDAINAAIRNGAKKSAGSLYSEYTDHYLTSSSGIRKFENGGTLYLSIRSFVNDEASGHSVVSSLSESGFKPERAARKAAHLASLVGKPEKGKEGRYETVLDPMVVAALTSEVGSMSSAYSVISGFSCFGGKIGRRVASEVVSVEDDATRALNGMRRFDDEGVAVRRTSIISRGILKSYLHNTSTARKFRKRTTGNAGLIAPDAFSLSMKGGSAKSSELIEGVKDGLYINNVWYTRYQNEKKGTFSTIPRDAILRIKNGEFAGSVKDIRITENLVNLLTRIRALSKEREHINWWLESYTPSTVPYALVGKLNITTSADA